MRPCSPLGQTKPQTGATNHRFDKLAGNAAGQMITVVIRYQIPHSLRRILLDNLILGENNFGSWVWKICRRISHGTNGISRIRELLSVLNLVNDGRKYDALLSVRFTGLLRTLRHHISRNIEHVATRTNVHESLNPGLVFAAHLTTAMVNKIRLLKVELEFFKMPNNPTFTKRRVHLTARGVQQQP